MPDPRYVPRAFAPEPADYGRDRTIAAFNRASDDPHMNGARLQHRIAVAIRHRIKADGYRTVANFARQHQLNYPRLAAQLRGETIMRLDDAAHLATLLHIDINIIYR